MKKKLLNIIFIIASIIIFCSYYYYNCYFLKKTISVMLWYGIVDENSIKEFEKKYNININIKYYYSNEELISKLSINSNNIDIIMPSDYTINLLINKNLIQPINHNKITCFKNLSSKLLENITYNKKYFGIPYAWAVYGIVINKNLYKSIITNLPTIDLYKIFFTGEYKNKKYKVGGTNDIMTIVNIAYQYYKKNFKKNKIYSKNNLLNIIQEILKSQYKNTIAYINNDNLDALLNNNMIDIALTNSADFIRIMNESGSNNFKFLIPEYYNLRFCEYFALTKNAKNQDLCYLFINFLLENKQITSMIKKNFWFHSKNDSCMNNFLINEIPLFAQIYISAKKTEKQSYYTDLIFNKKELLSLIMNVKS